MALIANATISSQMWKGSPPTAAKDSSAVIRAERIVQSSLHITRLRRSTWIWPNHNGSLYRRSRSKVELEQRGGGGGERFVTCFFGNTFGNTSRRHALHHDKCEDPLPPFFLMEVLYYLIFSVKVESRSCCAKSFSNRTSVLSKAAL